MIKAHCIEVSKGIFLRKYNLSAIDEICDMLSITITKTCPSKGERNGHDMKKKWTEISTKTR